MKKTRYILLVLTLTIIGGACQEDVDDMPPRVTELTEDFILPSPVKLTTAERDLVQAKRDAYNELYGD